MRLDGQMKWMIQTYNYVIPISYVSVEGGGGGRLSARQPRGGGQDFSAQESENSSAPLVAVNNDRSLIWFT